MLLILLITSVSISNPIVISILSTESGYIYKYKHYQKSALQMGIVLAMMLGLEIGPGYLWFYIHTKQRYMIRVSVSGKFFLLPFAEKSTCLVYCSILNLIIQHKWDNDFKISCGFWLNGVTIFYHSIFIYHP